MISTLLAFLLGASPLLLQGPPPPAYPREDVKHLFENERVIVWEATIVKGRKMPMHQHRYDMVGVELTDSSVLVTSGKTSTTSRAERRIGQVMFAAKGSSDVQEGASDVPARAIFIDLKDVVVPPLTNTSGLPPGFPRDGAKKIFENARVTVWDYTFTPGKPTPMHFHDKDVIAVFLGDGATSSTTPDGVTTVTPHFAGEAKFNSRNRAHTELLPSGSQRVIAVELK